MGTNNSRKLRKKITRTVKLQKKTSRTLISGQNTRNRIPQDVGVLLFSNNLSRCPIKYEIPGLAKEERKKKKQANKTAQILMKFGLLMSR